jgi:hypothetical protein
MLCYNRSKGWDCPQKSALLEVYEYQIERYLEAFHIPEDYQAKILEAHKKLQTAYDDTEKEQARLKAQLERLKKLFAWGDLSEKEYLVEKENTLQALRALTPPETKAKVLERLVEFLEDVPKAWKEANQEQRNKLARQLFDEIWVKDKQVIAVKPRPELKPFFQLSYEEWLKKFESENSTPLGVANTNEFRHKNKPVFFFQAITQAKYRQERRFRLQSNKTLSIQIAVNSVQHYTQHFSPLFFGCFIPDSQHVL